MSDKILHGTLLVAGFIARCVFKARFGFVFWVRMGQGLFTVCGGMLSVVVLEVTCFAVILCVCDGISTLNSRISDQSVAECERKIEGPLYH